MIPIRFPRCRRPTVDIAALKVRGLGTARGRSRTYRVYRSEHGIGRFGQVELRLLPGYGLIRSDFQEVGFRVHSGKHLLLASISPFDPTETYSIQLWPLARLVIRLPALA